MKIIKWLPITGLLLLFLFRLLYDRARICKAIDDRDYTMLGLRREAVFEQKRMAANTWEKTTAASSAAMV